MAAKTKTITVQVAAFLAGLVTGVLIGGCSMFGPGLGVSVY